MKKSPETGCHTAAFFDMDETIIRNKSMFVFMHYFLEKNTILDYSNYDDFYRDIQVMAGKGISREEINSFYYSKLCGVSQQDVRSAAKELVQKKGYQYIDVIVEKLRWHKKKNHSVIIISGAMRDIIEPILSAFDVNDYLCSESGVENGKYNGILYRQSIGKGKADAVINYCHQHNYSPSKCYAYGDHISDAPLLDFVGHGHAVNPDKELFILAQKNNWSIIEG